MKLTIAGKSFFYFAGITVCTKASASVEGFFCWVFVGVFLTNHIPEQSPSADLT